MTTNHTTSSAEPLPTVPRDQMMTYIASGRAEQWTYPLEEMIPEVSLLDGVWEQNENDAWVLRSGIWYVVWEDAVEDDVYELAPPELATLLSDFLARLRTAHAQVADSDAQHGIQLQDDVVRLTP